MISPTPVVVMKRPSAAPRCTTFVSPVTIATGASAAVAAMLAQTSCSRADLEAFFDDEGGGEA